LLKRIALVLLLALVAWLAFEWVTFPDVAKLATERPTTTAFMEQRKRELRKKGGSDQLEWQWVSYDRISPNLRRAVLVSEDNSFYEHEGVDVEAMKEAFERNWKRGRVTHGGSTITQQLAKNLYLSPSRNPLRKLREYFLARSLEKHLSKKRILEIYLNVVELGERVYGAQAGARHHFDKSASSLSASEAALLAGCLPNPRVMNPSEPNKRLRARQRIILSRMRRWGYAAETQVLTEKKPKAESTPVETPVDSTTDTGTAPSDTAPSQTVPVEPLPESTGTVPPTDTTDTSSGSEPAPDTAATDTTTSGPSSPAP
jgi:monofunctional glycosyltransferase